MANTGDGWVEEGDPDIGDGCGSLIICIAFEAADIKGGMKVQKLAIRLQSCVSL